MAFVEIAERLCYIYDVSGNAPQLRNELLNEPERLLIEFYRRAREATNNSPYLEFQKLTITPGAIHAERVTQSLLVRAEDVRVVAGRALAGNLVEGGLSKLYDAATSTHTSTSTATPENPPPPS